MKRSRWNNLETRERRLGRGHTSDRYSFGLRDILSAADDLECQGLSKCRKYETMHVIICSSIEKGILSTSIQSKKLSIQNHPQIDSNRESLPIDLRRTKKKKGR